MLLSKSVQWAIALGVVAIGSFAGDLQAKTRLQGAGATFPAPYYKRLVTEYEKVNPSVQIDYQSIGSGGGIKGITDQTVHFAGSDAPMKKSEMEKAGGADGLVEFPSCAGAVVPTYNLPGVDKPLKFTGALLADIFMGKVHKWNDPAIVKINPGVNLPDTTITPAWRTDGSGTTYVWTNYLITQSQSFLNTVGAGKQVKWPVGQGGKGNEGVTQVVQQTVGGIGYVEEGYADANKLPHGAILNKDGNYVKASPQTVSNAGAGAASQLDGTILATNIWNQPGAESYPAAAFTYIIVYKDLKNLPSREHAQALVDFLWWATHDGQKYAEDLDYAPLAPAVREKVEAALETITYKGQKLTINK